ncbi:MAG: RNA polymerase sigma factor [Paramuribaculum sp.]|nr:RNA polymerase sigma factor [Paramuribaculum sp.]
MNSNKFTDRLLAIQDNLLSFALILTSNRDDAYDLVQDTTLKVLDSEDKYTENINFKGWVFTIMRNIFINHYRKAVRCATIVDTTEDLYYINLSSHESRDTPQDSYSVVEITQIINQFREEYRVPFSMHLAGYKYQEIAQRMNLPVGTVKSRIFFARKRLRKDLDDYRYSD